MLAGHHPGLFLLLVLFISFLIYLASVLVGIFWIRPDANDRGQPGILWALLTLPLGWVAILIYLIVRALSPAAATR